jgi:hypothetical protein
MSTTVCCVTHPMTGPTCQVITAPSAPTCPATPAGQVQIGFGLDRSDVTAIATLASGTQPSPGACVLTSQTGPHGTQFNYTCMAIQLISSDGGAADQLTPGVVLVGTDADGNPFVPDQVILCQAQGGSCSGLPRSDAGSNVGSYGPFSSFPGIPSDVPIPATPAMGLDGSLGLGAALTATAVWRLRKGA